MGKATREEALEWMAQGHKARPPGWTDNHLRREGAGFKGADGTYFRPESMLLAGPRCATGWTLLGRRRVERERRIAELEAEVARLTADASERLGVQEYLRDQRNVTIDELSEQRDRALADLADLHTRLAAAEREVRRKEEDLLGWRAESDDLHQQLADLRTKLETAEAEVQRFHNYSKLLTKTHESIESRLRTELEAAEAGRPRFRKGDRVTAKGGRVGVVVRDRAYAVHWEHCADTGWASEDALQPAPEPQPEPEWVACSAAEAREKHAAGMRVRGTYWNRDQWIWDGETTGGLDCLTALKILSARGFTDWLWSHPLPGSGT